MNEHEETEAYNIVTKLKTIYLYTAERCSSPDPANASCFVQHAAILLNKMLIFLKSYTSIILLIYNTKTRAIALNLEVQRSNFYNTSMYIV